MNYRLLLVQIFATLVFVGVVFYAIIQPMAQYRPAWQLQLILDNANGGR